MKTHHGVTEVICRTPLTKKVSHNPNQNEEQIRKMTNIGIILVSLLSLSLLLGMITVTTANPVSILDNGTLLGVSYNSAVSEQDIADLQSFENWCGKKHSIVLIFQGFSPDGQTPFPRTQLDNIWQNGNTPLLTWEPWGTDDILNVIINGTLDTYFEGYAQELYNWTQENWTVNGETGTRKQLKKPYAITEFASSSVVNSRQVKEFNVRRVFLLQTPL